MTDVDVLMALRSATQRLVRTVDALEDEQWTAPSLLPQWSRAHVVAHLALNAEALATALEGVRAGEPVPMYAEQAIRDDAIFELAVRPPSELRERLLGSTTAMAEALADLPDHLGTTAIERVPGGPTFPAASVATMRLREVHIHHADLGLTYTCADWSADFAALLLDARAVGATVPDGCVAVATDVDRRWQFGDAAENGDVPVDAAVVRGPVRSLAWWATGRNPGADVTSDTGEVPGTETW